MAPSLGGIPFSRLLRFGPLLANIDMLDPPLPISPGSMATLDVECLVLPIISQSGEEDSASKNGYLQGLEGNIDAVFVPCPGPNELSHGPCEYSVKVQQVDDAEAAA
jgi:hypothetical protein